MDINKIDDEVLNSIANNMIRDFDWNDEFHVNRLVNFIENTTPEEAFRKYLHWHGIIGFSDMIIDALDNLRKSDKKET